MAASTANRYNMPTVAVQSFIYPVAVTTIFANCNVCVDSSGNLNMAADASGFKYVGVSQGYFNNSQGSPGAISAKVQPLSEVKYLEMDAVNPTNAWVGNNAFFTDDHTVAITGVTYNVSAGTIAGITSTAAAGKVVVKLIGTT
jgi:hypothetical protein